MYPKLSSRSDVLAMLDELTEARQKILDTCSRLSIDQLNDPVYTGTWCVLKTLAHLAYAQNLMLASIKCRPNPLMRETLAPEPALELAAIRTALDEAQAASIAFLKANPEAVLMEKCLFGRKNSEETVGGVYFHIVEHEIGHRAFVLHKLSRLQGK
jgi:uncharacterized damage-inducible protein DinB